MIIENQEAIDWFLEKYFPEKVASPQKENKAIVLLSDVELIQKISNSKQGPLFQNLFDGDTSSYPSASEGDMALLNILAYWTGRNPEKMEQIFGQSKLGKRDKWLKRPDYRERSINNAISACNNVYQPNALSKEEPWVKTATSGSMKVIPGSAAQFYADTQKETLLYFHSSFWRYSDGIWRELNEIDIKKEIQKMIGDDSSTSHMIDDVTKQLAMKLHKG